MESKRARSFSRHMRRSYATIRVPGLLLILTLASVPSWPARLRAQTVQSDKRRESSRPATVSTVDRPTLPSFMSPLHPAPIRSIRTPASRVFAVDMTAQATMEALWNESKRANAERVACIAGHMEGGAFHITRAEVVPTEKADSLRISPGPSLERCGPPEWLGTVHTHIATFHGRPFAMLSPSDRAVMNVWRLKWGQEGVFCVLYSETEAYCEYGTDLNADVSYWPEQRGGGLH